MLENSRFYPGETSNDPGFADQLAALADVYVDDAFGAAHRAHATTVGVPEGPAAAGLLMEEEIDYLDKVLEDRASLRRHPRRGEGLGQARRHREPARDGGHIAHRRSHGLHVLPGAWLRGR